MYLLYIVHICTIRGSRYDVTVSRFCEVVIDYRKVLTVRYLPDHCWKHVMPYTGWQLQLVPAIQVPSTNLLIYVHLWMHSLAKYASKNLHRASRRNLLIKNNVGVRVIYDMVSGKYRSSWVSFQNNSKINQNNCDIDLNVTPWYCISHLYILILYDTLLKK